MIRQLIVFLFAFVAIAVHAEPIRRRRQAPITSVTTSVQAPITTSIPSTSAAFPLSIGVPCPIQCSWKLSQAWAKAISFELPSSNMIDDKVMLGGKSDQITIMCSLYATYKRCLTGCDASNSENKAALDASPPYDQVCVDNRADFESSLPCLSTNTKLFQQTCQTDNENLLAASVRLGTQKQLDARVLRDYCIAANKQLYCIFPAVHQICGDIPYNTIRSLTNASMASIRVSVTPQAIHDLYPECESYFDTVANGIPTLDGKSTIYKNTTAFPFDMDNSTITDNTTLSIRRDDADGPSYDGQGGRMGGSGSSRFQTTTPPNGASKNINDLLALFVCSLFFCIFL